MFKRILWVTVMVLACVGCDQATKSMAKTHLVPPQRLSLLHHTVELHYTENRGGFLSLGATLPVQYRNVVFIVGVGALLGVLFAYLLWASSLHRSSVFALSLIGGGGVSNLIDRILHDGRVVDFIFIQLGSLHTGVFNVADVAITAGSLLLIGTLFRRREVTV